MTPIVDSSASTPAYAALLEQRRDELRDQLVRILVGRTAFLWEVGSGHGHFLTAYAAAHPDKLCIGVDIVSERVERARRKRDRARLANLHFLRAEARLFLQALPAEARINEVFILFPDPWPKLRHHKHRVLQPEFLADLARWAAPGCRVYFRSDFLPYVASARGVIREAPGWELVESPWPFEFETVFQRRAAQHESLIAQRRES